MNYAVDIQVIQGQLGAEKEPCLINQEDEKETHWHRITLRGVTSTQNQEETAE